MLTKQEETEQVLLAISKDLAQERERLAKVRANLDRIEQEHHIVVVKLADRRH